LLVLPEARDRHDVNENERRNRDGQQIHVQQVPTETY
jgi:hypothetical protein